MGELAQALWNVMQEGGSLGLVTWALSAAFFWAWKDYFKRGDISNENKVLISVGLPFAVVLVVYFFGVWRGFWLYADDTLFQALTVAAIEVAGSKGIFGVTKLVEKHSVRAEMQQ